MIYSQTGGYISSTTLEEFSIVEYIIEYQVTSLNNNLEQNFPTAATEKGDIR